MTDCTVFKLEIEMGNDAMQHAWDVADAIRTSVVPALASDQYDGVIVDSNGNRVGSWGFETVLEEVS